MIGCHINKNAHGSLSNSIKIACLAGATAMQFNYSPPTSAAAGKQLTPAEIAEINRLKTELGIYLVVHGKYIYNFCRTLKWQTTSLVDEIRALSRINCDVVLHQGKNVAELKLSREQALSAFVTNLSEVLDQTVDCLNGIILENSCQQGTELGFTMDELYKIYRMFNTKYHHRIGFCIDLCHIFVAGTLDMRDPAAIEHFFNEFDTQIGINKLKLVHFNDSNIAFDGHNDNHQDILLGHIGNPALGGTSAGLRCMAKHLYKLNIPMILETPSPAAYPDTIKLIRSWVSEEEEAAAAEESRYIAKYVPAKVQSAPTVSVCCAPVKKIVIKSKPKV